MLGRRDTLPMGISVCLAPREIIEDWSCEANFMLRSSESVIPAFIESRIAVTEQRQLIR
jgi:hypothetical protein